MKDSRADARNYALRLLRYRPRSKKEMLERLSRKGFNASQINLAIGFLENAGLIKDDILARELLRNATERKYLGRKGIEMFLCKRGIDRELISETLLSHTREMEMEAAIKLVQKRLKTMKNYPKNTIKRRLWGMLQRRGFPADVIYFALKSLNN